MSDYQQRVIDEQEALQEKIDKLQKFMSTAEHACLPHQERNLLWKQFIGMNAYNNALLARIKLF